LTVDQDIDPLTRNRLPWDAFQCDLVTVTQVSRFLSNMSVLSTLCGCICRKSGREELRFLCVWNFFLLPYMCVVIMC
jgi:hypothetical protein